MGLLNRHKTASEEDLASLHAADRFLVELIKFDNLALRIEGMLCRSMFDEAFGILDQVNSFFIIIMMNVNRVSKIYDGLRVWF